MARIQHTTAGQQTSKDVYEAYIQELVLWDMYWKLYIYLHTYTYVPDYETCNRTGIVEHVLEIIYINTYT